MRSTRDTCYELRLNLLCGPAAAQVPVEVSDEDDAAEAAAHDQAPKALPHRHQLAGGPASSSITPAIGHKLSGSGGSMIGRQASRRHSQRRTAESRRQASLRMASASRTDPAFAAAAAAALEPEAHGHHHSHLHIVAHHLLHHGPEHATINISVDAASSGQRGAGSVDGAPKRSGSPFASADGQSQTAAAVLGGPALDAAAANLEAKSKPVTMAVVQSGWPASGAPG
jgi:hypothetical protein